MKKILKIFSEIIFFGSLLLPGLLLASKFTGKNFLKVFLVSSGSMEPAIKTGSVVFALSQPNYQIGDIITFKTDPKAKISTTHRIVAFDGNVIKTAGDANNNPDPGLIKSENIIGKVVYALPYIGYLAGFIQTPKGFILLVIVPATILIYEELKSVFLEISNYYFQKRRPAKKQTVTIIQNPQKFWVFIPVFTAFLAIATISGSYFHDTETSTQNSFTAWAPTATPDPTTPPTPPPTSTPSPANYVVINEVSSQGGEENEWIEIYNPTDSSIDITNWKISDNNETDTFTSSSTSLEPRQYAIIFGKNAACSNCPPGVLHIKLPDSKIGNGLADSGDRLLLKNSSDIVIDSLSFGSDNSVFSIPPMAPNTGQILYRHPNGVDTDSTDDWLIGSNSTKGDSNP